jgi:hypothetical protein
MGRFRLGAACLGLSVFVAFSLGCMSLSFGGRTEVVTPESSANSEGLQRGEAFVPPHQDLCVYYPVAYVSPPNLEFESPDSKRLLQIVEQKGDCFRIVNNTSFGVDCAWKARGMLGTAVKTAVVKAVKTETPMREVKPARGP